MARISHENLEDIGRKTETQNFLSFKWYEKNKREYPTLNHLMWKIVEGQNNFLTDYSGLPKDSEWLKIAKRNHTKAWTKIFYKIDFDEKKRDLWLDSIHIREPKYPPTRLILWIYTMSSYLYWDLKESTIAGSYDKLDTLGPYRSVLTEVIQFAQ